MFSSYTSADDTAAVLCMTKNCLLRIQFCVHICWNTASEGRKKIHADKYCLSSITDVWSVLLMVFSRVCFISQ